MIKYLLNIIIGLLKFLSYIFLFYACIFVLVYVFEHAGKKSTYRESDDSALTKKEIYALFDTNSYPSDTTTITHIRCWESVKNQENYCAIYPMSLMESKQEGKYKRQVVGNEVKYMRDYRRYWEKVYGMNYEYNSKGVAHIADSLSQIATSDRLEREDLASLVVSFVQDMPYWYILRNLNCGTVDYSDFPCISGIPFGLLSPMETAYAAFGDCDSKSLLIYSLLRHLQFDPVIVASNEYAHAMIALNLPSSGDYIKHRGERFYFWETTAVGWKLGMLPPSCPNVNYWEVALSYDYSNNLKTN